MQIQFKTARVVTNLKSFRRRDINTKMPFLLRKLAELAKNVHI